MKKVKNVCVTCNTKDEVLAYLKHDGYIYCEECYCDNFTTCDCCDAVDYIDSIAHVNDGVYCEECYCDNFAICDECDEVFNFEDLTFIGDYLNCERCLDYNYTRCDVCGDLTPNDAILETQFNDRCFCESCYFTNITSCDECGCDFENNGGDYCDDCAGSLLNSYHSSEFYSCFTPERQRLENYLIDKNTSVDECLIGFEHEKQGYVCKLNACLAALKYNDEKHFNGENLLSFERDGSLDCSGFEMVSLPITFKALFDKIKNGYFKDMIQILNEQEYIDNKGAGLHIHVNKNILTDEQILQLVEFLDENKNTINLFCNRKSYTMLRWCNPCLSIHDIKKGDKKEEKIKKLKYSSSRYTALNTRPRYTIEFRIFNATNNHDTLISYFQFVYLLLTLVKDDKILTWINIKNLAKRLEFKEFLNRKYIKNNLFEQ